MPARPTRNLHSALALLVLFFALPFYYAFHRPFTPGFALSLANLFWQLSVLSGLIALGGGLGERLVPQLDAPPLARLALRAALGLGLLALAIPLVGSTLGLAPWLVWSLTLLPIILLRRSIRVWAVDWAALPGLWTDSGRFGRTVLILSAVILLSALVVALAPPLKFDALVYHLSFPQLYLDAGRIHYFAGNMTWGFPQLPQMLITWGLVLGLGRGALLGWALGGLCLLGLFDHLRARLGQRPAWAAVAALLAGASLAQSLAWGYVDWPSLLYAWALLFTLEAWDADRDGKLLILAGSIAGLLFGTKYTAGLVAALGALFIFWRARALRPLLTYALFALALAAPWLVRNTLATDNPVYPLLFPGGAMDAMRLAFFQEIPVQGSWLDLVFLPLRATLAGIEGGHIGNAPGYEASIGPLLLALSLFAGGRRAHLNAASRRLLRLAAIVSIGGLLVWAVAGRFGGHLIRTHLYYALFPAFAILAAFGFYALLPLRLSAVRVGRIVSVVVVFVLALTTLQVAHASIASGAPQFLLGGNSDQEYLEDNLGLYARVMQHLREELPPSANVLLLWETRGYYCEPRCESDEILDRWTHDVQIYGSPAAVLDAWRAAGYSHILYFRQAAEFVAADSAHYNPLDLDPLESTLDKLPLTTNFNDAYLLYVLAP